MRNALGIRTRTTKPSILNSEMTSPAQYVSHSHSPGLQKIEFGVGSIIEAETDPVLEFLDSRPSTRSG